MADENIQQGVNIKIANGQLNNKLAKDRLRPGELFWLTKHTDGPTENYVWSDGELIMGCPEGVEDNSYAVVGGTRSGRAVVYQGTITNETEITNDLFRHARVGDFWRFTRDATSGTFQSYRFKQNDFLMVTGADIDPLTGLSSHITFFRINNSFSETNAINLVFSDEAFEETTVSEALGGLKRTKWEWGGNLTSTDQINLWIREGLIKEGTVWYELVDNLVFMSPYGTSSIIGKRGDLWLYRGSEVGWIRVIRGYTDAEDIDYYSPYVQELATTFSAKHKNDLSQITNVKDVIDYLIKFKAELGVDGKIPIAQLPDSVFDGMRCGGTWNPLLSEEGISGLNINEQANWPSTTNDGNPVDKGTYFIVNIDNVTQNQDTTRINVQYWDKTQVDINDNLVRCLELNTGDWVIFTGYRWEKIDNTDRLSGIRFELNSKQAYRGLSEDFPSDIVVAGTPRIASDNKIGIRQENSDIVIGGIRLIDQSIFEEANGNFIPKYSPTEFNSIKNSHIEDTDELTTIHQNASFGQYGEDAHVTIYGNIVLKETEESREIVYNFNDNNTSLKAIAATKDNILYLPNKSGTLATTEDLLVGTGTKGYIPVFITRKDENSEDVLALADSSMHYRDAAIYDKLLSTSYRDTFKDTDLYKINFYDVLDFYYNIDTQHHNIAIDTDVIIGGNNSLHITKNLSFGNENTNNTIITSDRNLYSDSYAYKNIKQVIHTDENNFEIPAWEIVEKPKGNVYLGLPADSGVLLTTNSPIKGGVYLESNEPVDDYEEGVIFRCSDDWENTVGITTHTAVGTTIAHVYKPDQSVNKLDDVIFASVSAAAINTNLILTGDLPLEVISERGLHVYEDEQKLILGTVYANLRGHLYGSAATAEEAVKTQGTLSIESSDNWIASKNNITFNGSTNQSFTGYSPDQSVNKSDDVNFNTMTIQNLFVNYDAQNPNTDFDFRLFNNETVVTDAWLENMGISNGRQIDII